MAPTCSACCRPQECETSSVKRKLFTDVDEAARRELLKELARANTREWYAKNTQRAKDNSQRYAEAHPDRVRGYKRKWKRDNPDKVAIEQQKRRLEHPEVVARGNQIARAAREADNRCMKGAAGCTNERTEGKRTCSSCREMSQRQKRALIDAGLCSSCSKQALDGFVHCENCKIKNVWRASGRKGCVRITLSIEDFVVWYKINVEAARGKCNWCDEPFGARGPQIDHIHSTGELRATLCTGCNLLEGYGEDRLRAVLAGVQHSEQFELDTTMAVSPEIRQKCRQILTSSRSSAKSKGYAPISMPLDDFVVWYASHLAASGGLCEWCHEPFGKRGPIADHSHSVGGKLRALVCHPCNTAEGHGVDRIRKVLAALRAWRDRPR